MAPPTSATRVASSSDFWWSHVQVQRSYNTAKGGSKRWVCNYCHMEKSGSVERVRAHLIAEKNKGIAACQMVPPDVRARLMERATTVVASAPTARSFSFGQLSRDSCSATGPSAPTSIPPFDDALGQGPSSTPGAPRQTTLATSWHPGRRAQADLSIARFFYGNGFSFNGARTPYYKEMIRDVSVMGPSYTPPSYDALRTRLLDVEKSNIETALAPIKEKWVQDGVSLVGDGWSDSRSRSIHGILAYSRGLSYFIQSIDYSTRQKTATTLCELWSDAVEYVGSRNVIQFISDGEASNRAAGRLLEQRYPHLTWTPCVAHCLSNLLKDIGKLDWVSSIIESGRDIVLFMTRHHYALGLYRRFAQKELLKYAETRFAYNFIMLERLREVRNSLRQLVVSDEWVAWPNSHTDLAKLLTEMILGMALWDDISHILDITTPIVRLMRLVDGDAPCIGKVYEGFDRMIEQIQTVEQDPVRVEVLRQLCISRWEQYYVPLQAAAYVLDPEFQGRGQEKDTEVVRGWEATLHRMVSDEDLQRKIKNQLGLYRNKYGIFGWSSAQRDRRKVSATLWWEDYGADAPDLQALARRILSQGCSSSSIERLWSSFGHIASKKRNRLGAVRANDLVFVNANLRLLNKMSTEYPTERFISIDTIGTEDIDSSVADLEPVPCSDGSDDDAEGDDDDDDVYVDAPTPPGPVDV